MKFDPEQNKQISEAKGRGERRVVISFTPDQRKEWRAIVDQELAGKEENVVRARNVKAAAECAGFFGDVRRAILLSRLPVNELAAQIGVIPNALQDFQVGDADLPATALDRLIERLGLKLVQEIPR
jgi:hypothetical protein